jgi:hypothetical protein
MITTGLRLEILRFQMRPASTVCFFIKVAEAAMV